MKTKVSIIVAIDEKRGIGKNGDLLFKIPEDGKRLRTITNGHPLVMGRKTFVSLGRLLPNRAHIVITRDPKSIAHLSYQPDSIVSSVKEGIALGKQIEAKRFASLREDSPTGGVTRQSPVGDRHAPLALTEDSEIFIFGGGQIYKEALEQGLVDRMYITVVDGDYGADTFFPEYEGLGFHVSEKEEREADGYTYTFLTLDK